MCLWVSTLKYSKINKQNKNPDEATWSKNPRWGLQTTAQRFLEIQETGSYLQTLHRWQEYERQREEGSGTEFPQLSPWYTTPVDRPGVTHLQHQVHGSFTATSKSQKKGPRSFNVKNKIARTVVRYGQQDEDFYLQLVILQIMSKGSSRLTVSGIISKDSLISP